MLLGAHFGFFGFGQELLWPHLVGNPKYVKKLNQEGQNFKENALRPIFKELQPILVFGYQEVLLGAHFGFFGFGQELLWPHLVGNPKYVKKLNQEGQNFKEEPFPRNFGLLFRRPKFRGKGSTTNI